MDTPAPTRAVDLSDGASKLIRRGRLPGAYGYDLAADAFRHAAARGVAVDRLLPAAMPSSWMVNNRAASTVFQKWLSPELRAHWAAVLSCLEGGYAAWTEVTSQERAALEEHVSALCIDGQGIAAVSKVLALLAPQSVPLMDDSAIWFMTDGVTRPADDKSPTAGAEHFLPMLDAFSAAVCAHEEALIDLARAYELAPLDAAQVFDRLLWYDSFGHRHFGQG